MEFDYVLLSGPIERKPLAHFLITGHTGFKGAWLTLLLKARGHEVSGLALDPLPRSIYSLANLKTDLNYDLRGDVRSLKETEGAFRKVQPDFVLHLAAQALVREGFKEPYQTYETNVLGTLNVWRPLRGQIRSGRSY